MLQIVSYFSFTTLLTLNCDIKYDQQGKIERYNIESHWEARKDKMSKV